jgi:hypothetical protein
MRLKIRLKMRFMSLAMFGLSCSVEISQIVYEFSNVWFELYCVLLRYIVYRKLKLHIRCIYRLLKS